jgi:uncharacterized membrane protein HdeD (DUF308 family)
LETSASREGAPHREAGGEMGKLWWLWLISGVAWIVIALVVLQFDQASITTVGVLIGIMFILSGIEQFFLGAFVGGWIQIVMWLFGVLFIVAGIIALISPENTFAAIADILGFLFLLVGVFWIIQAFGDRDVNELWWLGLIAGILMIILAFWTGGQFFIEKAYVLLVFAGIWALMQGVTDIVKAFQIRRLGKLASG